MTLSYFNIVNELTGFLLDLASITSFFFYVLASSRFSRFYFRIKGIKLRVRMREARPMQICGHTQACGDGDTWIYCHRFKGHRCHDDLAIWLV